MEQERLNRRDFVRAVGSAAAGMAVERALSANPVREGRAINLPSELGTHYAATSRMPLRIVGRDMLLISCMAFNPPHPRTSASRATYHRACVLSALNYIPKWRLKEMAGSGRFLADIARAAGFYDQAHFSRTFSALTGMTPGEFRAARRPR